MQCTRHTAQDNNYQVFADQVVVPLYEVLFATLLPEVIHIYKHIIQNPTNIMYNTITYTYVSKWSLKVVYPYNLFRDCTVNKAGKSKHMQWLREHKL